MDKPISAGDLVVVVRVKHACSVRWLGRHFIVKGIDPRNPYCTKCLADIELGQPCAETPNGHGVPLSWLKRIPPLEELEGEKREETVSA